MPTMTTIWHIRERAGVAWQSVRGTYHVRDAVDRVAARELADEGEDDEERVEHARLDDDADDMLETRLRPPAARRLLGDVGRGFLVDFPNFPDDKTCDSVSFSRGRGRERGDSPVVRKLRAMVTAKNE